MICVVHMYFMGEAAVAQVLTSTFVSSTALRKGPRIFWPHHCDRRRALTLTLVVKL